MKIFKNITIFLIVIFFINFSSLFSFSQEITIKLLTEGEFAKGLVRLMKLQRYLPPAPTTEDYINILESLGISPLTGWDPKRVLTKENYTVLMTMAGGKEELVVEMARKACTGYVDDINTKWNEKKEKEARWPVLDELLSDESSFPYGVPRCPYARRWKDKDNDHKVDYHKHW